MDDTSIYFGTESSEDSSAKETTCTEKERTDSEKHQQITIAIHVQRRKGKIRRNDKNYNRQVLEHKNQRH